MRPAVCLSLIALLSAPGALAEQRATPAATPAKKIQPPSAATNLGLGKHDSNAPINVSSDNFIGDLATKVGTYIGNVLVIQGDMRLRADKVKVNVAQGKPTRIEAGGRVVVNAPNGTATGDNGIYELGPRTITMTGHVVLTKEKDVMRGTKLVMDLNTNLAHMYAQGMPGNRVQGLFIPPPQKNGGTTSKPDWQKSGQGQQKPADTAQTSTAPSGK